MRTLELFTGAGGLAMGAGLAGFEHAALVEFNRDACETLRFNRSQVRSALRDWNIVESDTRGIPDFRQSFGPVDLVAGGPPCQPFSIGGKSRGANDARDMFPEAVRAVRQTEPLAFVFENVKGLLRESFADYFQYISLQLTYPSILRRSSETWRDHLSRLEKVHTQGGVRDLSYRVVSELLNAADFGVPQKRERVFIVGFRSDLRVGWCFPKRTHSAHALERAKFVTGEYFDRHGIRPERPRSGPGNSGELDLGSETLLKPWRTVRDAISSLPDPVHNPNPDADHFHIPGARSYPGHTGSPIDEPAKTLKAGDHGVPGGENMVRFPNGSVRYFTLREAARIQTFPDSYRFNRSWSESMRQLGNAVPVDLSRAVFASVARVLATSPRK